MRIYETILELTGNTPLVKINKSNTGKAEIVAKLEMFNPLSSIKDRIAVAMIEAAEKSGKVNENTIFIEPTSGNTGIGLAFVCASKGYKLILTMPDTMSIERRNLLKALGAELVLTEGAKGMKGAIDKALELQTTTKNAIILQQFENQANPEIHRKTTAKEILKDTDGKIDYFVAGIGTGGTITGVGEELKKHNPDIKIIAVEPEDSPILSGGNPGPHKIQGIGAGFIPKILNTKIFDKVIKVSNSNAAKYAKMLAKNDGIFVGISSGAAFCAALEISKTDDAKGKRIVVIFPDTGERYLSTDIFTS